MDQAGLRAASVKASAERRLPGEGRIVGVFLGKFGAGTAEKQARGLEFPPA
jgi:hypothetical protein